MPSGKQTYVHMDPIGNTQSGTAYITITGCSAQIIGDKLYLNINELVQVGGPPVTFGQNQFSNDVRTIQAVFSLS